MKVYKPWLLREGSTTLAISILGLIFLALGVHGFWSRPVRFGVVDSLGCVVGAFGGFFLLIIADYLLHHARLALIPWLFAVIAFAVFEPHLSLGLSASLWFILATQYAS
jgi:hypothetical protein